MSEPLNEAGSISDLLAFRVETRWHGSGVAVVAAFGEIDAATTDELERALAAAIDGGAGLVVVDLAGSTFVDSMTLAALLRARERLRARNGELRLACLDPRVERVFALTQLDRVFAIHATVEDALARPLDAGPTHTAPPPEPGFRQAPGAS